MPPFHKAVILVADGDEARLAAKSRLLLEGGFEVLKARSGQTALDWAAKEQPQLLLLNEDLPGIGGIEVCRRLKSDPQTSSILVLIIAAPSAHPVGLFNQEVGADLYISEPLFPGQLVTDVNTLLRTWRAEHLLYQRESRFQRLVENAQDIIYRFRFVPARGFEYVSPATTTVLGVTPEEFYVDPDLLLKTVHPDDRPALASSMLNKEISPRPLIIRWRHRNGNAVWMEHRNAPVYDAGGELIGLEGIARDITERKRVLDALSESQAQLSAIVGSAMDPIIAVDAAQRITLFNAAAEAVFLCPAAQALGQPLEKFIPARFRSAHRGHIVRFGRTNVTRRAMGSLGAVSGLRANGDEFPAEASISQVEVGGEKIYTVILRDITERKRFESQRDRLLSLEQAARKDAEEAQQRLALLADASAALAVSLDYKATLEKIARLALPAFADWCIVDLLGEDGFSRSITTAHRDPAKAVLIEELARRDGADSWDPRLAKEVLKTGESVLLAEVPASWAGEEGDQYHREMMCALAPKSLMMAPLAVRGRVFGTLSFGLSEGDRRYGPKDLPLAVDFGRRAAMAIDNARLFEAERNSRAEAETASRVKDEFLANLSHELRTPLNAVLGWTRILQKGKLDGKPVEEAFEIIERNAKTQAKLVDDILDLSRIIAGKFHLDIREVDLTSVINAAIDTVMPAAHAKSIQLESSLDEETGKLLGDPDRLQQLVWNLLSNAIKFTNPGGRVHIALRRSTGFATITVSDSGEGISADFLPFVFDRLRQADGSTARKYSGLGLGLTLVRHLAEQHGGTVRADSPGKGLGATFTVQLPLKAKLPEPKPASSRSFSAEADPLLEGAPPLKGLRFLIVDDESDSRHLLKTLMERTGAWVTTASSCDEAMQALAESTYDLILADIGMPVDDGYALIRKVRDLEPDRWHNRRVPAVAVTGYAGSEHVSRAHKAGYQAHIAKPVDPAHLIQLVHSLTQPKTLSSLRS